MDVMKEILSYTYNISCIKTQPGPFAKVVTLGAYCWELNQRTALSIFLNLPVRKRWRVEYV